MSPPLSHPDMHMLENAEGGSMLPSIKHEPPDTLVPLGENVTASSRELRSAMCAVPLTEAVVAIGGAGTMM